MKIVVAPDSFKESMTAEIAAHAIVRGIKKALPQANCVCLPMADGGEGTASALLAACGGEWRTVQVHDPLMRKINARYALLNDGRAVIEMAEAAGLHLLKSTERNPLLTTTFGVGELLLDALDQGIQNIVMAIGGSATNDGGAGMLCALGYQFLNADGEQLPQGGAALSDIRKILSTELDPRLSDCQIMVACDVDNPLCGERGASTIFAPQKGADSDAVAILDAALCHFADIAKDFLGKDLRNTAGVGAAGGLGFALCAFLRAEICSGVDLVAEVVGLERHLIDATLVITGEGKIDGQTASGKVPYGVLRLATVQGVPVIALAGCLGEDIALSKNSGYAAILPIIPCNDPNEVLFSQGSVNLERSAYQVGQLLSLGMTFTP